MSTSSDQKFKADAGKLQARLLFEGVPNALKAVVAVLSYGAQKYEAHSWKNVQMERYKDAKYRHLIDSEIYPDLSCDDESGLPHVFHEACNSLFLLETALSKLKPAERDALMKFNKPPQEHKK